MNYSKIIIKILNLLDYIQQKKIIKYINNKFSKPVVVFDVGAHYGETIKLFLNNLNVKKIYSFEASPKNFQVLKENIKKIKFKEKVNIYNYGLGEKISKSFINQTIESSSSTINELNSQSKYFEKKLKILKIQNKNFFYKKIPIEIITLDYFIKKNNVNHIDVLKIDTEGFEFNILRGLSELNKKVELIYFEHHYDDMIIKNYKFSDIHRLLKKMDFFMVKKSKMIFRKSFEYIYEKKIIKNKYL